MSTLYFQTRLSYSFVQPRPPLVSQREPSARRIASVGAFAERMGSSKVTMRPIR
jgi:hypothetical protein